jgi:predicted transcriptional regulator
VTQRVAQLEMECLKVLWSQAQASVSEVRERLPRPLAYTTVMTVLDRMSTKGLVRREKRGRAFVYAASLDREAARAQAVGQLLSNLFERDPRALIEYLAAGVPDTTSVRPRARAARRGSSSGMDDVLL